MAIARKNDGGRYEMNAKKEYLREAFDEIASTNDYAKSKRAEGKNRIITARLQTGGRGTKGRSFVSNEGGVYLTKLTFYDSFPAKDAFLIMANAAAAVCDTLRFYGVSPVIKWVNDIYINDKKICGILIENVFSGDKISSSVVGIGVNIQNHIPDDLADIATTLEAETGKKIPVEEVTERLIAELEKPRKMRDYLAYIGYMGTRATLLYGEDNAEVTLLRVDEEGGLWVDMQGEKKRFAAAEVSLRLAKEER